MPMSPKAAHIIVYKIPYRRTRAWPSGCIQDSTLSSRAELGMPAAQAFRLYTRYPIVARASKGILHTSL